jgi:carboxyl-terminal processing protease
MIAAMPRTWTRTRRAAAAALAATLAAAAVGVPSVRAARAQAAAAATAPAARPAPGVPGAPGVQSAPVDRSADASPRARTEPSPAPAAERAGTAGSGAAASPVPYRWFDPVIDLRAVIVDGFVDEVDAEAMQRAALEGMAASLGDPNSAYLPPEAERSQRDRMSGSFVGIGVELALDGDRPAVVTALDDSPAQAAGICAGDTLLSVDGRDTRGLGAADLEELLPGEPGTEVTLELRSTDGSERRTAVRRALIETAGVKGIRRDAEGWVHRLDPDRRIGYVRIAAFNDRTLPELDAALARMRADGLSGLVIDLRDNGGGSLEAAIGAADRFLREGAIVSLRGRGADGRTWDATRSGDEVEVPLVVLVNQGSASASEVMAGALRDHGRARLVGTRSFGKGSVQDIRPLADGAGAMKLTTARYYLPGGSSVARIPGEPRWGVEPETGFRVPMTAAEARAAGELRRVREGAAPGAAGAAGGAAGAARETDVDWSAPGSIRERARDLQLAAAVETLQGYLDAGEWAAVGDLSGDVGAGNDELRAALDLRRLLRAQLSAADDRISRLRESGAGVDDPLLAPDAQLIDGEIVIRDRDGRTVWRWIVKDPATLRRMLPDAAVPGPEYTPAVEPEAK